MPDYDSIVASLTNKNVTYRYCGNTMRFALSHALFSSAAVDTGTHMLLAILAEVLRDHAPEEVVDLGCGTGTAGISLAAAFRVPLRAYDRDALATAFTATNARSNRVQADEIMPSLGLPALPTVARRIVVCNMPAKAGHPVINDMIAQVASAAGGDGWGAVVIVKTLESLLLDQLERLGASVVVSRGNANHRSVVFSGVPGVGASQPGDLLPAHYVRTRSRFEGPSRAYEADTVYNLPEFDGLSFRTALVFELLRRVTIHGSVAIYGAGQGHIAEACRQRMEQSRGSASENALSVYDRDLLALRVTAHNGPIDSAEPIPSLSALSPRGALFDWLLVNDDPVPGSTWNTDLLGTASQLLRPEGKLIVASRSTSVARLLKGAGRSLRQIESQRMGGYRADLLSFRH